MNSRDIDAQIAEKIFGWIWEQPNELLLPPVGDPRRIWAAEWDEKGRPHWLPHYSSSISDAWMVADKICGDQYDYVFRLERLTGRIAPGRWWAYFEQGGKKYSGHAPDAPLAICLAALKAFQGSGEGG